MSDPIPRMMVSGEREVGVPCAHCGVALKFGESTAVCRQCGALHHDTCWQLKPRCGSYECSTGNRSGATTSASMPALTITSADLAAAVPLPSREAGSAGGKTAQPFDAARRWNRASVGAFILSLIGIPLFGIITGLIAIVVACIGLAGHTRGERGLGLGVAAMVIGLAEVFGWAFGLSHYLGTPQSLVALEHFTIDPESLQELPDRLARALRANVLVQTAAGLGQYGFGSGVVLAVRDGSAWIVTNRHVVDHSYSDGTTTVPRDLDSLKGLSVMTVEQTSVPAKVEWIAPHGVDLAIISAPILGDDVREAHWDRSIVPHIGDSVFAIGNPQGLGWTHSAGDISQVRRRVQGGYDFRILQTTAAINPGNSGGGLYDADGRLIGINTLTSDKRFGEGLSFSISLPTLLELLPERLSLPDRSPIAVATPAADVKTNDEAKTDETKTDDTGTDDETEEK